KQGQTEAQDPSVGVIVDGVNYAYNALTSSYDFTDVDTLEVTQWSARDTPGQEHHSWRDQRYDQAPQFHSDRRCVARLWPVADGACPVRVGWANQQQGCMARDVQPEQGQWGHEEPLQQGHHVLRTRRVSGRIQFLWIPTSHFSARISGN